MVNNSPAESQVMEQVHQIPTSVVKADRTEISDHTLTVKKFEIHNSQLIAVEGATLPDDLQGYYFVAAALAPSSTLVINGDGMMYRVEFKEGQATLKTRIAKTPCYYIDQAIQKTPDKYPRSYHFTNAGPSRALYAVRIISSPTQHIKLAASAKQPFSVYRSKPNLPFFICA